jgi:hypothetical protein
MCARAQIILKATHSSPEYGVGQGAFWCHIGTVRRIVAGEDLSDANPARTGCNPLRDERPPEPGGDFGLYEEQVAQWVAEKSFFRDFVYRNAKGKKKGDQLVDGIVLFGDVMFLIEVKAQIGSATRDDWVRDLWARP